MHRSVFWLLDRYADNHTHNHHNHTGRTESATAVFETAIEQAVLAEQLGFQSLWLAEHHFQKLGTIANPAILLAAIARHTETLRLGPAVAVLPLRNPIQLAEDYALVDLLSDGRLNMGVGSGSRSTEFEGFGIDFNTRHARFEKNLEILRSCWDQSTGANNPLPALNIAPKQSPGPPIFVAAMQEGRAYEIGCRGDSMLTLVSPMTVDLSEVARRVEAHRRGLRDANHDAGLRESVAMVMAYAADSEAHSRLAAIPALTNFIAAMAGQSPSNPAELYEQMRERGTGVFGDDDNVKDLIARYAELGFGHLAFITRFGGMSVKDSEQSLRRLAPGAC